MDLVVDLRTKAARERAWRIGDRNWMRRWLLARASAAQAGNLEVKSRFGAKCLALAAAHRPALLHKSLPDKALPDGHWRWEPRIPKRNDGAGRWTQLAGDALFGLLFTKRGGHHFVHQSLFRKLPLPPETRKVFEQATTGPLGDSSSNLYNNAHRTYNKAVGELLEKFVSDNNIEVSKMTPKQAADFLKSVVKSNDPRIRDFNKRIYMREIMRALRIRLPSRE